MLNSEMEFKQSDVVVLIDIEQKENVIHKIQGIINRLTVLKIE